MGLEVDEGNAWDLWESAAKSGEVKSRHMLGRSEFAKDNMIDAVRHWHIAAASGYTNSMNVLIDLFERGLLCHKDLAKSLRARDKACLDMRSDIRDRFLLAHAHYSETKAAISEKTVQNV